MDRASFPRYNNTKIIKFGWKLFILLVSAHGLSFTARPLRDKRASPLKKRNIRFLATSLWSTVIFFTCLDRASFPHYNNTKILKLVENFLFPE